MKLASFIATVLVATASHTSALADDLSFQRDKQKHFAGSIVMGAAFNAATDNPWKAFAVCTAVGVAVEAYQGAAKRGTASGYDVAYDVAGCAIGAYTGHKVKGWILAPRRDGAMVAYNTQF